MDFLAIDFETANCNRSPCSLGLTFVKNDKIVECKSSLINPKEPFDSQCISVHGITPEDVKSSPEFPEIWASIKNAFSQYPIVAHNISFDYSVLCSSLEKYDLPVPSIKLFCTLQLARKNFPQLENYKLDYLCKYFDITLKHHHSCEDDSVACALLMLKMSSYSSFELFQYTPPENGYQKHTYNSYSSVPAEYAEASVKYNDTSFVSFENKTFVITGDVPGYSRDDLKEIIINYGGSFKTVISSKTDYLIVGMENKSLIKDKKNIKSCKIIKAEQLRAEGSGIEIISYEDFLKLLNNHNKQTKNQYGWFDFYNERDKSQKLKALKLIPATADIIKPLYYCGISSNNKLLQCDVVGYINSNVLVIRLSDKYIKICAEYLLQMQPTKKEAEKVNVR